MAIPGGLLIAVEGIDGAGKTTLARGLASLFSEAATPVTVSKEPTAGTYGAKLRASAAAGRLDPETELSLLLADRREHIETIIGPALARGEIVILDRYYLSNVAYQGAAGLDPADLLAKNEAFAPPPDLILLLDLPVEVGLARIAARGDIANAFEQPEALARVRDVFLALDCPHTVRIDARDSADKVLAEAAHAVLKRSFEKLSPAPEQLDVENSVAAIAQMRQAFGPVLATVA